MQIVIVQCVNATIETYKRCFRTQGKKRARAREIREDIRDFCEGTGLLRNSRLNVMAEE